MRGPGEIQYATTADGIDVAYAMVGDGPRDVVLIHGFTTHLDFLEDSPWHAQWTHRLAERFRVIQLDKRGTGLSDRSLGHGSVEDRTRDLLAVMDAAGSARASIVGISEGGPIALTFTATYPERVERLVLYGTFARVCSAPDYPEGIDPELVAEFRSWVRATWGRGEVFGTFLLTHAADPEAALRFMAKFERNACTPQMASTILERNGEIDIRSLLPTITVPTMVLHNSGDPLIPVGVARYMAEHIHGAVYVEADGNYHGTWDVEEFAPILDRALAFLGDEEAVVPSSQVEGVARSVATILFTDIVGSTDLAASLGDARWADVLEQHHRRAQEATRRRLGTLVKTTGDGVLALFDGPSRAIQAVHDLRRDVEPLGLQLRAGIHTGEIERSGRDVAGIGVHIAARVMALAGPDEVLVSRTARDLAVGSRTEFAERGAHELRGVPGSWELFAVTS